MLFPSPLSFCVDLVLTLPHSHFDELSASLLSDSLSLCLSLHPVASALNTPSPLPLPSSSTPLADDCVLLLSIELQAQEQPPEVRSGIYSHMEAFVPCNKEALLKRLKKLSFNIQVRGKERGKERGALRQDQDLYKI